MERAQNDRAAVWLKRAIALEPQNAAYHRDLAGCYERMGNTKKGAAEYRRFLKLAPNDPAAPQVRQALKDCGQSP